MAPQVAALMAAALNKNKTWEASQVEDFRRIAEGYLPAGM
jgi:hypothetical protein